LHPFEAGKIANLPAKKQAEGSPKAPLDCFGGLGYRATIEIR
jgi:hypothetical protein